MSPKLTYTLLAVSLSAIIGCSKQGQIATHAHSATSVTGQLVMLSNGTVVRGLHLARKAAALMKTPVPTVLFLNFNGETVDGGPWGMQGETIDIARAGFTAKMQQAITNEVAEDFWFLNTLVTTSKVVFDRARGTRIECIVARKDQSGALSPVLENFGGIAVVGSVGFNEQIPCFTFVDQFDPFDDSTKIKKIACTISHEIGHAYGCGHNSEYFDGTFIVAYKGASVDFRYGDIMGNATQSYLSRFCDGQSGDLDGALQKCGEIMAAVSGYREGITARQPLVLPIAVAASLNIGLVHVSDQQALLKIDPRERTVTIASYGDLEPYVAVYPTLLKRGTPTIYHTLNDTILISRLRGPHLLEVYTAAPDTTVFSNPPSGGGRYQVTIR